MEEPERPVGAEEASLAAEAEELRRQVLAGAGSPEELRELAERLRAHREHEDDVWRRNVRPGLKRPSAAPEARRNTVLVVALAAGLCVVVVLVVLTQL